MLQDLSSKLAEGRRLMSSVEQMQDPEAAAPRAGADLRAARERLGWSLVDVAETLRIRRVYLQALEEGRLDELPGNAYAVAFARTYASRLGLDPDEMGRRFKAEAGNVIRKTKLAFPVPVPERGVPAGAVVLLGVMLAVGAYAGWYRLSGEGRLPAEATVVPARLAPLAEQALPPRAPPSSAVADQAATPADSRVAAAPTDSHVALAPSPTAAVAAPVPPLAATDPSATLASAATAGPAAGLAEAGADQTRIVVRASADAWLMVRERGGAILLNRTLKLGETWPVPPRPNLVMTTGNAGGTELVVDGVAAASLGKNGAVRRELPLDADMIKDGKLAQTAGTVGAATQPATPRPGPQ
jgi:cytoskeleton protein RodZ